MKVAILLCGQIRTFELTKWVLQSIKNQYDCDVFMGINPNNLHQNQDLNGNKPTTAKVIEDTIQFVRPKQTYIMDEIEFSKSFDSLEFNKEKNLPTNTTFGEELITRNGNTWEINNPYIRSKADYVASTINIDDYIKVFEQYFVVNECYRMLINHIDSTNTKYDVVVRLRFDQLIWTGNEPWATNDGCLFTKNGAPCYSQRNINLFKSAYNNTNVEFIKQEDNILSVLGWGTIKTYAYVNDQFWTHGMDLVQRMSKFYDNLIHIVNQSNREHSPYAGADIEHLLLRHLYNNNINIRRTNVSGRFIREFEQ